LPEKQETGIRAPYPQPVPCRRSSSGQDGRLWLSRRGFDSHPPDHLATAAGMASDSQRSNWVRELPQSFTGSWPNGLGAGSWTQPPRFNSWTPCHGRWCNQAARCALNAEVSGSIPERPAKVLCARSLIGQALHYECSRWRFESSRAYQDYRPSSNWIGRGLSEGRDSGSNPDGWNKFHGCPEQRCGVM
jgi:hypothetical protein